MKEKERPPMRRMMTMNLMTSLTRSSQCQVSRSEYRNLINMTHVLKGRKDCFWTRASFGKERQRNGDCSRYGVRSDKSKDTKKVISLYKLFVVLDIGRIE